MESVNRINLICLGVRDMATSIRFYRDSLGFQTEETSDSPAVIFFNTTGTKFELFPLDQLRKDIDATAPPAVTQGFSGMTLAINVRKKEHVKELVDLAIQSGATLLKAPVDVFWGGYHAYFSDPDGYVFEVAWGPEFNYDENDMLVF
ncbi:VOC family protein [Lacticigenium naphthae]|uniref:VOC family protein n=1 Tax=Lacticigenium naphthae TaxID=515351 RepID=UPI00040C450E|nr:VOC family protein [Lacticigenium naphthae]